MPEPKITFADEAPGMVALGLGGVPLMVSPGASDLLAAFRLAFTMFRDITQGAPPEPEAAQVFTHGESEEEDGALDLRHLNSLSPIARAEVLSMYGLKTVEPEPQEPDPTAATVAAMLEQTAKDVQRRSGRKGEVE